MNIGIIIKPVRLKNVPDPACFDAVTFGAPVQGFSLSPVMKAHLTQMRRLCRAKGADISETCIVNWTSKLRDDQISDVTTKLGKI